MRHLFQSISDSATRFIESFIPDHYWDDEEEVRLYSIVIWICLGLIIMLSTISLVSFSLGTQSRLDLLVGFLSFLGGSLIALKKGVGRNVIFNLLMAVSYFLIVYTMYNHGGLLSPRVIYLMLVPALVGLVSSKQWAVFWTVIGVLTVLGFLYLHRSGQIESEMLDLTRHMDHYLNAAVNFGLVIIFIGLLFLYSDGSRRKARESMLLAIKKSDNLLLNILPEKTAKELLETGTSPAKYYDQVTVLFTDFEGFTQISEQMNPQELVAELDRCFQAFDRICEKHGLEKIKTIGDAYMAAGGLPEVNSTNPIDVVNAALEIRDFMVTKPTGNRLVKDTFKIRIGVHTGPVVAGIVGIKKFQYDIWGDTVNMASRMESSGEIGRVNISNDTYELVKEQFSCEFRGEVQAKGKGLQKMYFVNGNA